MSLSRSRSLISTILQQRTTLQQLTCSCPSEGSALVTYTSIHRLLTGLSASASGAITLPSPPRPSLFSSLAQTRMLSAVAEQKPKEKIDSLELTEEKMNAITDQIPQRPMGVVEGTSYSLVILFAFGALAFVLWQFVANFILEPTAMQCFNHTLERLKTDPRITVRLGSTDEIRAWGSNSQSRIARQQVPHQIYKDANGVEHVRIQFYMRGPSGTGQIHADMYKDSAGQWQYNYLLVDVYSGSSQTPSRIHIVSPH